MILMLIFLIIAAAFDFYLLFLNLKKDTMIADMRADEANTKLLKVSYTLTESDLFYNGHPVKEKKIPPRVRKILAKQMASEITTYFQHMERDKVNGYTRYSYTFQVRQEYK